MSSARPRRWSTPPRRASGACSAAARVRRRSRSPWWAPACSCWAISDAGEAPIVVAYELKRVEIDDYAKTELAQLVADTGIEVTGAQIGATGLSAAFLGLGPGRYADRFKEALADAARRAGGTPRL